MATAKERLRKLSTGTELRHRHPTGDSDTQEENIIMLAMDSSHYADDLFQYYLQHVHRRNNKVVLLYVMELPDRADDAINHYLSQERIKELWNKETDKAASIEEKYVELLKGKGVHHVSIVNQSGSKPGKVICKVAEDEMAHMIIIGSKGRGRISGKILGSTSAYVVHHANCPVLVCRHGHMSCASSRASVTSVSSANSSRDRHKSGPGNLEKSGPPLSP